MSIVDAGGNAKATYKYDPYGNLVSSEPAANSIGAINPIRYRGYYYDTDSQLYYLQSRYYDPELGRFINADAFASTGQGLLGMNMFAYCNNNPVNLSDSHGTIPFYDDPLQKAIEEFLKWYQESDSDEIDDSGKLTINAKTKRIINAFLYNVEFSSGVGQGYFVETTVLEAIGLGFGVYGNYFAIRVQDGQVEFGQEYNTGISASFLFHNFGFTEYAFNKDFKPGPIEVSKGFYGDETYTIFSAAGYIGIGGSIRIGFDVVQFGYDVAEIIR